MAKILILEDDILLNKTVTKFLNNNGYEVVSCFDGEEAYDILQNNIFDLILSDIMMPNVDGFEFLETIREFNKEIPIIFMSADDDFDAKQKGYRLGVDDYLVKPVNLEEMSLKIGAILRRLKVATTKKLVIGEVTLNTEERFVTLKGEEINLTVREFDILFKLLSYPKKTFTRAKLMEEFWDIESESSSRTVDVYIAKLRDKFSDCDDFEIQTVHGLGYKAVIKQ
ncbi:MAG: response regulator transcription factor [Anaerocolumna sp.]